MNYSEENKEDFCAPCLAIPLAMSGVGVSASGDKKMMWIGIGITVIFSLIAIYYLYFKDCKECKWR